MDDREWDIVRRCVARLRASTMAIVFGMLGGTGLFAATAWLLIRGGPHPGHHLRLLANYYPGYSVSWPGAFVGFLYGALTGAILGYAVAWIYNTVALRRL